MQRRDLAATSWGDLAWYSEGSYSARPWFYAGYGTARTAWSVGNPVQGMTLCKFGRTTGQTCDEVYIWLSTRDLFSRAANLPNAMGVRVLQPDSTGSGKGGFQSCGSERVAIRSVANGNVGHSIYGQTLGTWNNGSAFLTRVTESTFNSGQWYAWSDQEVVLADTYAYCVW